MWGDVPRDPGGRVGGPTNPPTHQASHAALPNPLPASPNQQPGNQQPGATDQSALVGLAAGLGGVGGFAALSVAAAVAWYAWSERAPPAVPHLFDGTGAPELQTAPEPPQRSAAAIANTC